MSSWLLTRTTVNVETHLVAVLEDIQIWDNFLQLLKYQDFQRISIWIEGILLYSIMAICNIFIVLCSPLRCCIFFSVWWLAFYLFGLNEVGQILYSALDMRDLKCWQCLLVQYWHNLVPCLLLKKALKDWCLSSQKYTREFYLDQNFNKNW